MDNTVKNPIYDAILESVELTGRINALESMAHQKLSAHLQYASSLSSTDNKDKKLEEMKTAIAIDKMIRFIGYLKGDGVPECTMNNLEGYHSYCLSIFK